MTSVANIYARLGIKTVINGQGTYTTLGGSLMPPEVVQAMAEAAGCVCLDPRAARESRCPDRQAARGSGRDGDGGGGLGDHGRDRRLHGPR